MQKILHAIWHDELLPKESNYTDTWNKINPEAEVNVWTFEELENILHREYDFVCDTYNSFQYLVQQANVLRYIVVHKFGGIYMDIDTECIRPLNKVFDKDLFLLSSNSMIGSTKHHTFWMDMLTEIVNTNQKAHTSGEGAVMTGSTLMVHMMHRLGLIDQIQNKREFLIGTPEDPRTITIHHQACGWDHKPARILTTLPVEAF